jgi:hypothetical protein
MTNTSDHVASTGDKWMIGIFAVVLLVGIFLIRWLTWKRSHRGFSSSLVKLYGLLGVGGFAVMLAVTNVDAPVKTAGFTLLGTIAGFLSGASLPEDEPTNGQPPNGGKSQTPGQSNDGA